MNANDFVVMKIDLQNAFNLVSRQALLDECRVHFSELFQWAAECYGDHPLLLSAMGTLRLESGVQQGDPLGFCLVLHRMGTAIAVDSICSQLSFHSWYMDDGVIAGPKQAALQALSIFKQLGPPLGLFINTFKCELFSKGGLRGFPDVMKKSNALNFEILGAPIGDPIFCAKSIAEKRANAPKFLALLKEVGSVDFEVALLLLRQCGGFCWMVHIARCTPPSVALDELHLFVEVCQTFSDSMCIDPSDLVWQQAQLSLSRGGLGLRSASLHSSAAFMSSFFM